MYYYNLPLKYNDKVYFFNKFFGALLYREVSANEHDIENNFKVIPTRVLNDYQKVLHPYKLTDINDKTLNINVSNAAKLYANILVFICKYSFFFARIFSHLPLTRFENTEQALYVFTSLFPSPFQHDTLCLPRTFFAASTSRSFKKKGTAFIGVFLPTKKMHAWIIEDNKNPDSFDNNWISYQPIIAITK